MEDWGFFLLFFTSPNSCSFYTLSHSIYRFPLQLALSWCWWQQGQYNNRGGCIRFKQPFRLRHVNTDNYLAIQSVKRSRVWNAFFWDLKSFYILMNSLFFFWIAFVSSLFSNPFLPIQLQTFYTCPRDTNIECHFFTFIPLDSLPEVIDQPVVSTNHFMTLFHRETNVLLHVTSPFLRTRATNVSSSSFPFIEGKVFNVEGNEKRFLFLGYLKIGTILEPHLESIFIVSFSIDF